jgi:hypothetical protein
LIQQHDSFIEYKKFNSITTSLLGPRAQKFVVVVRPQVMIITTIYAFKTVVIVQRTSKIERETCCCI